MQHLEEKIAHLIRTVDDLDAIVTDQRARLERLERLVQALVEREAAREAEGGGGVVLGDERPPHY